MKIMRVTKLGVLALSGLVLQACGGGGGGAAPAIPSTLVGKFVDAPVQGLYYDDNQGLKGMTNAQGQFNYVSGRATHFILGGGGNPAMGIELGYGLPDATGRITPYTLTPAGGAAPSSDYALNIAQTVQGVNTNASTPDQVLVMPADNATSISGASNLKFNLPAADFQQNASNNAVPLAPREQARASLNRDSAPAGYALDFKAAPGGRWDVITAIRGCNTVQYVKQTETYDANGVTFSGQDGSATSPNCVPTAASTQTHPYADFSNSPQWYMCLNGSTKGACTAPDLNRSLSYVDGSETTQQVVNHTANSGYMSETDVGSLGKNLVRSRYAHVQLDLVGTTWTDVTTSSNCVDGSGQLVKATSTVTFNATTITITGEFLNRDTCTISQASGTATYNNTRACLPSSCYYVDLNDPTQDSLTQANGVAFTATLTNANEAAQGVVQPRGRIVFSHREEFGRTVVDAFTRQ